MLYCLLVFSLLEYLPAYTVYRCYRSNRFTLHRLVCFDIIFSFLNDIGHHRFPLFSLIHILSIGYHGFLYIFCFLTIPPIFDIFYIFTAFVSANIIFFLSLSDLRNSKKGNQERLYYIKLNTFFSRKHVL